MACAKAGIILREKSLGAERGFPVWLGCPRISAAETYSLRQEMRMKYWGATAWGTGKMHSMKILNAIGRSWILSCR